MHKGRRISIPVVKEQGEDISIPVVEESSHNWRRFAVIDSEELQGRPTKVLKKFVDAGTRRNWWSKESLRKSEAFKSLIRLVWGEEFLEQLERHNRRKFY